MMHRLHVSPPCGVRQETRQRGEHRIRRLALKARDGMEANCEFKAAGI
jgi:hypothetical protein